MHDFSLTIAELLDTLAQSEAAIIILLGSTVLLSIFLTFALTQILSQRKQLRIARINHLLTEKNIQAEQQNNIQHQIRAAKLITLLKNERKHGAEKLTLLEEAREELSQQFSTLAQQILTEKSVQFSELNKEKLEATLQPFNQQLQSFKKDINDIYLSDTRERASLKSEILQLRDLNQQVNQEAINLTKALKGDTKVQGNWGELVLERVLEQSGLRRGSEYETQGGFRDSDNKLKKPDVIIHLPEEKDIIIDSKVSLISWEKYVNAESDTEKEGHLHELVKAIKEHISLLSSKDYPNLKGIKSLDFVLMFMPIEAAFATAYQHDEQLFAKALRSKIIIVSPTTLLATLRTIENIWQYEHQSKNSIEIARRAGIMYDKFRGFAEDMEKFGRQLNICNTTYDAAMTKLTKGRGNLIAHSEQLKELGIQSKKSLPRSILELSELEPRDSTQPRKTLMASAN